MVPYRCLHPDPLVRRLAGASAMVNLAFPPCRDSVSRFEKAAAMEDSTLRLLIRDKLADGRLQRPRIAIVWGGPANGETCVACEELIPKGKLVIEGITGARPTGTACFHLRCFQFWDSERTRPGWTSTEDRSVEQGGRVTGHVGEAECLTALTELSQMADRPERTYLQFAFTNGQATRLPGGSLARLLEFGRNDLTWFIAGLSLRLSDVTVSRDERHAVRRLVTQLQSLSG